MNEDGTYTPRQAGEEPAFNIHREFYKVTRETIADVKLF
jgi:hypothetical protein